MLFSPLTRLEFELDAILRKKLDKRLFAPKRDDILRLTRLQVWSLRYSVPLEYIVEKLVPYFEKISQRHYVRRNAGSSKGLGVSVAVLTGQVAEEKLREFISKDFPDDEHIAVAIEERKERCLAAIDGDLMLGRPRPILHYGSVDEFVSSYSKRIERNRKTSSKIDAKLSKQTWRGNPFR